MAAFQSGEPRLRSQASNLTAARNFASHLGGLLLVVSALCDPLLRVEAGQRLVRMVQDVVQIGSEVLYLYVDQVVDHSRIDQSFGLGFQRACSSGTPCTGRGWLRPAEPSDL